MVFANYLRYSGIGALSIILALKGAGRGFRQQERVLDLLNLMVLPVCSLRPQLSLLFSTALVSLCTQLETALRYHERTDFFSR